MKIKFTDFKGPSYLDVCLGKPIKLRRDDGSEFVVECRHIAHSFKYRTKAVINGQFFIDYFDLFKQVYGDEGMTEDDWEKLRREFNALKEEEKREILGYDTKFSKALGNKESVWTKVKNKLRN